MPPSRLPLGKSLLPNGRAMKNRISGRCLERIARVRNLADIYTTYLTGAGQGRRSYFNSYVLRTAMVLKCVWMTPFEKTFTTYGSSHLD